MDSTVDKQHVDPVEHKNARELQLNQSKYHSLFDLDSDDEYVDIRNQPRLEIDSNNSDYVMHRHPSEQGQRNCMDLADTTSSNVPYATDRRKRDAIDDSFQSKKPRIDDPHDSTNLYSYYDSHMDDSTQNLPPSASSSSGSKLSERAESRDARIDLNTTSQAEYMTMENVGIQNSSIPLSTDHDSHRNIVTESELRNLSQYTTETMNENTLGQGPIFNNEVDICEDERMLLSYLEQIYLDWERYHTRSFIKLERGVESFMRGVFVNQLYAMSDSKSEVDQMIQRLREKGRVCVIDCSLYMTHGLFITLLEDYIRDLHIFTIKLSQDDKLARGLSKLGQILKQKFYGSRMSYTVNELCNLKSNISESAVTSSSRALINTTNSKIEENQEISDCDINHSLTRDELEMVLSCNFLRRDSKSIDMIWINHPSMRYICPWLMEGNKEIENLIKRKKYQEIKGSELIFMKEGKANTDRRLKSSKLPVMFHVYDMVGRETLKSVQHNTCNLQKCVYRLRG